MRRLRCVLLIGALFLLCPMDCRADEKSKDTKVDASPKKGWGDFKVSKETEEEDPWWMAVLLWAPNRILDFIDIFHVDVGVGPSRGAVLRVTQWGQVGYRTMRPASVRIGAFGRRMPFMIERSNEFGAGPAFAQSKDRDICPGELGVGADVFLLGAYAGFCPEEVLDFVAGIFFLDVRSDDLR